MNKSHVTRAMSPVRERQRRSIIQPRVGARNERLPWDCQKTNLNPNGVASPGPRWMQPFQGWGICLHGIPRVAAMPQPWAERWNPVGIRETATAGTAE